MKTRFSLLFAVLCGLANVASLHAQSTAFTYQGRLTTGGGPANGSHDFQFTLFGAPSGGSPVESPVTLSAVGVTNGVFTVSLDFGASVFNGADRWLNIAVRPAGSGTFTSLTPRQPITPTPYAVTAFNALTATSVTGLDGYSLNASDGSITDALFVDGGGEVGIGTTVPAARLHVVSAQGEAFPPRLESRGNNRFSAGWDFYHSGVGKGYVGVPDASAGIAPGELVLFGGPGVKASLWGGQVRALTTDTAGNVSVRGELRMGPGGEVRAAGGEENLRIVRGTIKADGTILRGSGFTVSRAGAGTGDYRISFTTPFASSPTVTVTPEPRPLFAPGTVMVTEIVADSCAVLSQYFEGGGNHPIDRPFNFIAIGPR
jgi:hypothetical protein